MSERIILVTPPDDISVDGCRLFLINLTQEQSDCVSEALKSLDFKNNIIVYIWNGLQDWSWFVDKKIKSDIIIFNADSENELITGYLAGQYNSYYFGNLKILDRVNNRAIYSSEDFKNLIKLKLDYYEQ